MTNFSDTETSTVELAVQGMTCGSCKRHVGNALAAVPGAAEVAVSLKQASATVRWATSVPDVQALIAAVRDAGYDATVSLTSGSTTRPIVRPTRSHCCCGGQR